MLENKSENKIKINKEGAIYALIFLSYFTVLIFVFINLISFLRTTINNTLKTPASEELENKYSQLDLEKYNLISNKLGFSQNNINPVAEIREEIKTEEVIASTTPVLEEEIIDEESKEITEPKTDIIIVDNKPIIAVYNSTTKPGLAADLKRSLLQGGYEVAQTGNNRPSLAITTIKVKNKINPDSKYLEEIKKIVDTNYDFVILPLEETSSYDLEIIIGNK